MKYRNISNYLMILHNGKELLYIKPNEEFEFSRSLHDGVELVLPPTPKIRKRTNKESSSIKESELNADSET